MSDISKFSAISSKLEEVALSICSSSAELPAPNQEDMLKVSYVLDKVVLVRGTTVCVSLC